MKKSIDPAFIRKHKKNQILELSRRSLTSVGAHIVLFIFVAVITPLHSDHPMLLTLFGCLICFISVIRLILAKKVPEKYDNNPVLWQLLLKSLNYTSGALWGILAFMSAQFYPLEWPFMFILIINCGLAAGATSSLGPDYGVSRNFTLLIMMPIAAWGFLNGSALGIGVAILCLFCAFMFIRMAKDNAFWYWENIENNVRIKQNTDTMADLFKKVMENAQSLNRSSQDLTQFSGEMKSNAGDMSGQLNGVVNLTQEVIGNSDTVVSLMDQATQNFSNIASASEEMTSTINDIAQSTQTTHEITAKAVGQSEKAVQKMKILDESATAINKITEAIGEISEQINLLALNATIEAARAGEAGKGFAVVASEIKELAIQTSASASEINHQVNDIQNSTADTSQEMAVIKQVVMEANQRVEDITHAIDEQSKATKEVSRNINELSEGFSQVTQFISQNDDNLKNTNRHILELQTAADRVKEGALKVDKNAETLLVLASDMTSVTRKKSISTESSQIKEDEDVDDSLENNWPEMAASLS